MAPSSCDNRSRVLASAWPPDASLHHPSTTTTTFFSSSFSRAELLSDVSSEEIADLQPVCQIVMKEAPAEGLGNDPRSAESVRGGNSH